MSSIDDLIRRLCPNGVEYRPLSDAGEVFRGRRFTKTDYVDEGLAAIHYGELYTHYGTSASQVITRVRAELAPNLRFVEPGDVVIAEVGETLEDVGKAVAWLGDEKVAIHDGCYGFRSELDPTFVSYYLQTPAFHAEKNRHVARAKLKRLSIQGLRQIRIPIPPLEVQCELVRVLDLFQSLEAELEEELEARRRQYAHYRSRLLVPDAAIADEVPLDDIATFRYGHTASAADVGDYRFIRITDITEMGTLNPLGAKFVDATPGTTDYLVRAGDLLMARTGATFGKTLHIAEDMDAVYASFLIRIRVDTERLLPRYYWHFAQSELYWRQARALASHGGQPQFNGNALRAVLVPVPSIDDQARVVATLDSFDALVNDHSTGLPAELRARRTQFEHYRDRLLTFEEAE